MTHQRRAVLWPERGTLTHISIAAGDMVDLGCGAGCALYHCGTAAISNAILSFVSTDNHILVTNLTYETTQDFCRHILDKMNIATTWFNPLIGALSFRIIYGWVILEFPGSITMEVQEIPVIVRTVRARNPDIVIMLNNIWVVGILLKTQDLGVDISLQAVTKYLIGHFDEMIDTTVANVRCWDQLRKQSYLIGQMVDADTAYMASRGCVRSTSG